MQNFQAGMESHYVSKKQFIMSFLYRVTDSISLRPPSQHVSIYFWNGDFVSVLAFRPHVNCVLGHQKRRFSKTVPRVEFFKIAGLRLIFTSYGVGVGDVSEVVRALFRHRSRSGKQSHKRDGIGVGRIRTFPFSYDSAYDSVAYDLVKTRLSESRGSRSGRTVNHSQCTFPRFVIGLVLAHQLATPTT